MPVDTIQFFGALKHPSHAANCQAVNIELFVSQGHVTSISIAIPISISIILPNGWPQFSVRQRSTDKLKAVVRRFFSVWSRHGYDDRFSGPEEQQTSLLNHHELKPPTLRAVLIENFLNPFGRYLA